MPRSKDGGGFSGPLSVIAVASIALGVVVMVMAVSILRGFQGEIAGKVVGFGSHLTVSNYAINPSYQENPVTLDDTLAHDLRSLKGVKHLQSFATKGGMVKTKEQIYGILLRGLSADYDTSFFAGCLVEGNLPRFSEYSDSSVPSNEVLISSTIANKLNLKVGDKLRTYFWQGGTAGSNAVAGGTYRSRAFTISGIYNTDLPEVDELYAIGDLRQVQKLNDWCADEVGGYELLVDDFDQLEEMRTQALGLLTNHNRYDLTVHTIKEAYPALFAWLDLLNSNITLILIIMSVVCAVAIVSALLIMIFEKSRTIGVLKALGASNASVRRIFILKASRLILQGIAIGIAVSGALCFVQAKWEVVKLNAESYHMSHVPVDTDPWIFVIISASSAAVCLLALLLPAAYISRISPAKTIKTE
jgi:lipoprotein-releasing system permease protein